MAGPGRGEAHPNATLTWNDVRWIRASDPRKPPVLGVEKCSSAEAARKLGISPSNVRHIRRGLTWIEEEGC